MVLVVFASPLAELDVAGLLGVTIGVLRSAAISMRISWLW